MARVVRAIGFYCGKFAMSRPPVCSHCGMVIGDHFFVRQGEACCCENGFLESMNSAILIVAIG